MPIYQGGVLNTAALTVPDLYVQIIPPGVVAINGAPSNKIGIVGTATWGPVGIPAIVSGLADYTTNYGPIQVRKYDAGTQVGTSVTQGANAFAVVRSTDGTDTAATIVAVSTCLTLTARYTGTLGNSIQATMGPGSKGTGYFKLTISLGGGNTLFPAQPPEVFDNLAFGLTGNAVWVAIAAAINTGTSIQRPGSKIVVATAGAGTTAGSTFSVTLAGGTDGASTPAAVASSPAIIYGVDGSPRTGMFALRNSGCATLIVADMDTSGAWTTVDAFASSEGMYAVQTGPVGDTITNAVTVLQGAGISSVSTKMMFGDWITWNDPVNQVQRLVSPQGFIGGKFGALSPNRTTLNQALSGIVGTQRLGVAGTSQNQVYSEVEKQTLVGAGICVISNPSPGGFIFSDLVGHNTSSSQGVQSDTYTRMVNFIAASFNNATMGKYVGRPIVQALYQEVTASLNQFFGALVQQGLLTPNNDNSLPYNVICNATNNPQSRTSLGYFQADCYVTLEGIVEKFIVNLNAGSGIVTTQPAQAA